MFALALTMMMPLSALADSRQVTAERVRRPPTQWGTVEVCTKTMKMSCKQDCPSFWEHVGTSDYGCCTSWSSCGGYRKTCQLTYKDFYCYRRRSEAEPIEEADLEDFMSTLEMVDGHWVKLSSPRADSGVAQRFLEAGLRESESTFEVEVDVVSPLAESMSIDQETDTKHFVLEAGEWVQLSQEEAQAMTTNVEEADEVVPDVSEETNTKHFVLENGDWVQLSQEEAKGMTTIVDEVDEVHPEVSEDARRRWSLPRFPGWPSGLKRCRDEMEMPCNMPCYGGGWMLVREIENGCCMNGPGGIDHPKPCGFTTKVCQKFYLCHRSG